MTARGIFLTGTDTGVGKTLVACALLRAFAKNGYSTAGMKPVAAGGGTLNNDISQLRAASTVAAPLELTCPYPLDAAIAPHIAAKREGIHIELEKILQSYDRLQALAQVIIVEGIGGFKVPLNDDEGSADLAQKLNLPVVLTVGMRLGCLSHALLTVEAIQQRGLILAGWVANHINPNMEAIDENVAALKSRISAPFLGVLPFDATPDPALFAGLLELEKLKLDG